MARKTIDLSLSTVEADHLAEAINRANADHKAGLGRTNPALDRVAAKLHKARQAATEREADDAGKPDDDGSDT